MAGDHVFHRAARLGQQPCGVSGLGVAPQDGELGSEEVAALAERVEVRAPVPELRVSSLRHLLEVADLARGARVQPIGPELEIIEQRIPRRRRGAGGQPQRDHGAGLTAGVAVRGDVSHLRARQEVTARVRRHRPGADSDLRGGQAKVTGGDPHRPRGDLQCELQRILALVRSGSPEVRHGDGGVGRGRRRRKRLAVRTDGLPFRTDLDVPTPVGEDLSDREAGGAVIRRDGCQHAAHGRAPAVDPRDVAGIGAVPNGGLDATDPVPAGVRHEVGQCPLLAH